MTTAFGRPKLIADLHRLNAEAKAIAWKTSPAAADKHAEINAVLDQIVGR